MGGEKGKEKRRGVHGGCSRVKGILMSGNESTWAGRVGRAEAASDHIQHKMQCCSDMSTSVYYSFFFALIMFLLNKHSGS